MNVQFSFCPPERLKWEIEKSLRRGWEGEMSGHALCPLRPPFSGLEGIFCCVHTWTLLDLDDLLFLLERRKGRAVTLVYDCMSLRFFSPWFFSPKTLSLFQSLFPRSWLSSSTTVCFDEKWVLEFYSFFLTSFFSCRNLSLDFLFLLFVIHRQSCIPLVENLLILLLQQDCRVRSKNV